MLKSILHCNLWELIYRHLQSMVAYNTLIVNFYKFHFWIALRDLLLTGLFLSIEWIEKHKWYTFSRIIGWLGHVVCKMVGCHLHRINISWWKWRQLLSRWFENFIIATGIFQLKHNVQKKMMPKSKYSKVKTVTTLLTTLN